MFDCHVTSRAKYHDTTIYAWHLLALLIDSRQCSVLRFIVAILDLRSVYGILQALKLDHISLWHCW